MRKSLSLVLVVLFLSFSFAEKLEKTSSISVKQNLSAVKEYVDDYGFTHKLVKTAGGEVIDTAEYLGNIVATTNAYPSATDYSMTYYIPAANGFISDAFVLFGTTGSVNFHIMKDSIYTADGGGTFHYPALFNNGEEPVCYIDEINGFAQSYSLTVENAVEPTFGGEVTYDNYTHVTIAEATYGAAEEVAVTEAERVWVGWRYLDDVAGHEVWSCAYHYGYGENAYGGHSYFSYGGAMVPYRIIWGSGVYEGDITMRVVFRYPDGTPPVITGMNSVRNTYATDVAMPIYASITDGDGEITDATIKYSTDGTNWSDMEMGKADDLVGPGYWLGYLIGEFNVGDTISYYIEATDNDGKTKDNSAAQKRFIIKAPANAEAKTLVVCEHADDIDFYETVLTSLGVEYELWSTVANNGIDASVVGHTQWHKIIWSARGTANYMPDPSKQTSDFSEGSVQEAVCKFLEKGGALFYSDYDYFYAYNLGETASITLGEFAAQVSEGTLPENSFGYQFFNINQFGSDPMDAESNQLGEYRFKGVAGDPISADWAETTLDAAVQEYNWGDYIATAEASNLFLTGNEFGLGSGSHFAGTNFATVFIPWNFTVLCDTVEYTSTQAEAFMTKVLEFLDNNAQVDVNENVNRPIAARTKLGNNYPNPFNPSTEIQFQLALSGNVKLEIFDISGRCVNTILNKEMSAGSHTAVWNGLNKQGQKVSSGLYFYRLTTKDFSESKKMMLIK